MTPLMITLLVIAGIVILIAIGYMNHVVENNKLEKARAQIELNDRLRRCGEITETFPGQLMTPQLKLLLTRLELNVNQRMLHLNKSSATIKARIAELEALVGQGESIPVNNPGADPDRSQSQGCALPARSPARPGHPRRPGRFFAHQ